MTSTIDVWINPLRCIPLEFGKAGAQPTATADDILSYVFAMGVEGSVGAFAQRYQEVVADANVLAVAPNSPDFLNTVVWPLRQAVGSYALGNFVGCIALCGTVGETMAVLLWDISKLPPPGRSGPMTREDQVGLLGKSFDKLQQWRRRGVLRSAGLIDDATATAFKDLAEVRNKYVHVLSTPQANAPADARRAVSLALQLVRFVVAPTVEGGAIGMRPALLAYLSERQGKNDSGM